MPWDTYEKLVSRNARIRLRDCCLLNVAMVKKKYSVKKDVRPKL